MAAGVQAPAIYRLFGDEDGLLEAVAESVMFAVLGAIRTSRLAEPSSKKEGPLMSASTVLFIGGTGIISSAAAARAVELGHDLTVLNRGSSSTRPTPPGVEVLTGDVSDPSSIRRALGDRSFDVVVDFVAFTPDQVQADIDLFTGRAGQYVFISSASAYQKPVAALPIRESSPLRNPF